MGKSAAVHKTVVETRNKAARKKLNYGLTFLNVESCEALRRKKSVLCVV
jgi:hypothetical protein